ncbi:RWD domain-containing protein 2A [Caerostris extrusa]|uniref:RWD domain-containing protein 2A n=1 Tax=Caerostris extrusa TaxID=172846 RepID=A0AAV4Y8G7_CAEEX|nr:RWD domain-containing protein 2A [Caerostris extrusa]
MWIYSHHIYSKFKRRDILELAQQLKLTGFSLPGKPGLICCEGTKNDCCEFYHQLKLMSWKKLSKVKEEIEELSESSAQNFRRFEDFQEISFSVRRGPANEYHMDMGQFLKYLEDHNSGYVFHDLFGIEARVSSNK